MGSSSKIRLSLFFYKYIPIILLFISVLNESNINYTEIKYFSFNFTYILIFFYSLRRNQGLGYTYVFIAGLFNDAVVGTPMGLSSLMYLIICVTTAYIRNITLRPSLIKDSIFFLSTILIVNSLTFISLNFVFEYQLYYFDQMMNIIFTFLMYFLFASIFHYFEDYFMDKS